MRFHSLLVHTYERFCAVADPHEAFRRLDEAEVMLAVQALGLDPPASAAALELPADLPAGEPGAVIISCRLGIEPHLNYPELLTMMSRTALAVNERYQEAIIYTQLWNDLIPENDDGISYAQLLSWLEELGVVPAPVPGARTGWRELSSRGMRPPA